MKPEELKKRNFKKELVYSTSRSSGPGGQNINKLNSKVELRFSIRNTVLFSDEEKEMLFSILSNKINGDGEIIFIAQSERTQLMNKKMVTENFFSIVSKALTSPAKRRETRPTNASVKKRVEQKRKQGSKKKLRKISGALSGE
jgi:ribosome-associated protein